MTRFSHVRLGFKVQAGWPHPPRDWRSRQSAGAMLLAFLAKRVVAHEAAGLKVGAWVTQPLLRAALGCR